MNNLYLIKCTSYRILNEEIKRIAGNDANITTFSLNDVTIYDCIDDASYFGLFEEKRVIIIKDSKYFSGKFNYDEEVDALENFFKNLNPDTIIIFVVDQVTKTKRATQALVQNNGTIIDLSKVDDETMERIIDEYTKDNKITLEKGLIPILKNNCLSNIDIMIQEIDKLSLLSTTITKKMVEESGSIYIEYKNKNNDENFQDNTAFDFSNAVVAKKFSEALKYYEKLVEKGAEVQQLVGLLASSFTTMYMVKKASSEGMSDQDMTKLFGFSNPNRVSVLKRNSKIYTLEDLQEIILSLCELDIKSKTGYNADYEIKKFLLNL